MKNKERGLKQILINIFNVILNNEEETEKYLPLIYNMSEKEMSAYINSLTDEEIEEFLNEIENKKWRFS